MKITTLEALKDQQSKITAIRIGIAGGIVGTKSELRVAMQNAFFFPLGFLPYNHECRECLNARPHWPPQRAKSYDWIRAWYYKIEKRWVNAYNSRENKMTMAEKFGYQIRERCLTILRARIKLDAKG